MISVVVLFLVVAPKVILAFLPGDVFPNIAAWTRTKQSSPFLVIRDSSSSGEVGSGPNWIERSFPVDMNEAAKMDPKTVIDYDLGISGTSYQTGSLSKRLFEAIESKSSLLKGASAEVRRGFLLYTMDTTAKEAVRAALKRNGLELVLADDEQEEGIWADIDSIILLDDEGVPAMGGTLFDSWEDAVDHWSPGQGFDFVARQVPAKMRELSLDELLQALDPDGSMRQQAKAAGMRLPDDGITCLKDMANDNVRRVEMAPRQTVTESEAYAGIPEQRGYQVVKAKQLMTESRNADGTENENVLMHVMDAIVNHGCLIVDLTDGGTSFQKAEMLQAMWMTARAFFEKSLEDRIDKIPTMRTAVEEVGSTHAKVGFASYHDGNMQFLETRLDRQGQIFPQELQSVVGSEGCRSLEQSFQVIAQIAKDIVRIVVGASSREAGILNGTEASQSGLLVANELLDDGKPLDTIKTRGMEFVKEGSISMSPHRICLYSNNKPQQGNKTYASDYNNTREIFGAHTDSTFVTAVPVSAVSGLEIYDEDVGEWYRPEKAAWQHWQAELMKATEVEAQLKKLGDDMVVVDDKRYEELPWHARYVVFLPGELLQLCSRNEVMATVHRVVATKDQPRVSAPVLLRGRLGIRMDYQKYLGGLSPTDLVLKESDGMTMEQIHDAMQPSSFQ